MTATNEIDSISTCITLVGIFVTLVGIVVTIGASVFSWWSAKKARKYKDETHKIYNALDINRIIDSFSRESSSFQQKIRKTCWYKGINPDSVITPFSKVLKSIGKIYPLTKDSGKLKEKVHSLDNIIQQNNASKIKAEQCAPLILEISDLLLEVQYYITCEKENNEH